MKDYYNYYNYYQIIFKQEYNFLDTAKTLEGVLQRLDEFIFLLYSKDENIIPLLLLDSKHKELFNNVMHITLVDFDRSTILELLKQMRIYAKLKLKQHYAIPFTVVPEPFPLYKILADYYYNNNANTTTVAAATPPSPNTPLPPSPSSSPTSPITANTTSTTSILFALHAIQKSERVSIASFLRKHDLARTSIFYAYADMIRQKLLLPHYHCTLLLACTDSKIALLKALTAFKVQHFSYTLKSNTNNRHSRGRMGEERKQRLMKEVFAKPKKPFSIPYIRNPIRYPVLSSIEVVSLMLPDNIQGVRTLVDGIRPYTTGRIF